MEGNGKVNEEVKEMMNKKFFDSNDRSFKTKKSIRTKHSEKKYILIDESLWK